MANLSHFNLPYFSLTIISYIYHIVRTLTHFCTTLIDNMYFCIEYNTIAGECSELFDGMENQLSRSENGIGTPP